MFERRDVLKAALGAIASGLAPSARADAPAAPAPQPPAPPPFSRDMIVEFARSLAGKPYAPPPTDLVQPFASLTYEQFVGIKTKPGSALWAGENRGFSIEPLHRGNIFTAAVDLFVIENGVAARIAYDQSRFDYGSLKVPEKLPDIGYSGFRVLHAQPGGSEAELSIFQGASFYRAVAAGQNLGVTARGLSIRTADPRGEEFPAFRSFWIEKPLAGANALTIHALLDSPSVAGVYHFTVRPGEATIIDAELTLFPRTNVDHYGLAGFAGASLFTPLDRRRADDLRVAATAFNGLQMLTGANEWLWRPVSNREELQFSSFMDVSPKGFGALMRNRDVADYQDDDQHWERRPSLWVEPLGEWGEGAIQLVEIPSESENNENIVAYWRPKTPLVGGAMASFAYRQFWCWAPPSRPPMAVAVNARSGRIPGSKLRRFVVVFSGDILADQQKTARLSAALTTSPGSATNVRTFINAQAKTCRVVFDVDPAGENFCEMRLVLRADETQISETWLYRWTP
ncbi:glucan biosynthesis protein [Methylocystis parvus]|uniref:Glucan biosynthesis protein n=1 Tax=Methylocystis parvus TaxID=134 RepID=A0A6B8M5W2_9HYPH|nr:glucan biosynthesis protein [Methylocystis parvus]QGM98281.1 glucan biosynthesis protein [Methylocystis parvus]WBK01394.1 glucan biosynthesis protein [Methylocystis parvus OBBP]